MADHLPLWYGYLRNEQCDFDVWSGTYQAQYSTLCLNHWYIFRLGDVKTVLNHRLRSIDGLCGGGSDEETVGLCYL